MSAETEKAERRAIRRRQLLTCVVAASRSAQRCPRGRPPVSFLGRRWPALTLAKRPRVGLSNGFDPHARRLRDFRNEPRVAPLLPAILNKIFPNRDVRTETRQVRLHPFVHCLAMPPTASPGAPLRARHFAHRPPPAGSHSYRTERSGGGQQGA